jgi:cytochrome P450
MTLLSLNTAPSKLKALLKEIQQATSSASSPITWSQTQRLPYLQAVVREGLRMWPPIGGLGFKRVPPGGETINGYHVPEGTEIGQGFLAVGRSKAVWGEDANVFRPERWLNTNESELKRMISAVDTHFGAGKYSCMGKPIAVMELHKAIFEVRENLFKKSLTTADVSFAPKAHKTIRVFCCESREATQDARLCFSLCLGFLGHNYKTRFITRNTKVTTCPE